MDRNLRPQLRTGSRTNIILTPPEPGQLLLGENINMNRFIVSANYMVDGRVQKRTYIVAAQTIIEAIRSAKTDDLIQVTSVALDGAPTRVDPFGMPEETENKNV